MYGIKVKAQDFTFYVLVKPKLEKISVGQMFVSLDVVNRSKIRTKCIMMIVFKLKSVN